MENRSTPTEAHAEAILNAAGSSLRNYTMPATRDAILAAVQAVYDDAHLTGYLQGREGGKNSVAYALACIANPDWSSMTAEDARKLAKETLDPNP